MGKGGTDVSKEAADMILVNDDFCMYFHKDICIFSLIIIMVIANLIIITFLIQ